MTHSPADYPAFDDAVERLREFLRRHGRPDEILWISPEDCALDGPELVVRIPEQSRAEARVRDEYLAAVPGELGVTQGMLCTVPRAACCYVHAPKSAEESDDSLMPNGLKLSIPACAREARLFEPGDARKWECLRARTNEEWLVGMLLR